MISAILALLAQAGTAGPAALDWEALPALPYRVAPVLAPPIHSFAAQEAKARHCRTLQTKSGARNGMRIDVAVLVDEDQSVRVTVPRSADCPTVEQYAAGLVSSFARNNLLPRPGATEEQWYRTTVTFIWDK